MKKLLSIFLCMIMLCSIAVPVKAYNDVATKDNVFVSGLYYYTYDTSLIAKVVEYGKRDFVAGDFKVGDEWYRLLP